MTRYAKAVAVGESRGTTPTAEQLVTINAMTRREFSADELYTGGTFKTNVNMGTLANGMYNVVITSGSERWTVRLVRQ